MISKWYWFKETTKQIVFNLFCKDETKRMWLVGEDRLDKLQQIEKNYKLKDAECNLYRVMYETQAQKYTEVINWIQENWKGLKDEK